jgi:hypothetical protein
LKYADDQRVALRVPVRSEHAERVGEVSGDQRIERF